MPSSKHLPAASRELLGPACGTAWARQKPGRLRSSLQPSEAGLPTGAGSNALGGVQRGPSGKGGGGFETDHGGGTRAVQRGAAGTWTEGLRGRSCFTVLNGVSTGLLGYLHSGLRR